ncbi:MAG: T9SS type A sorting domain-containing protein, partial [Bacteroidota bacterium]|nr:T9SS type A sorting domain-containing protein [Bacteroidota bacterium]
VNNQIYSAKFGVWVRNGNRNQIINNTIGSTDPLQEITYRSISMTNVDSTLISGNDIFNNTAAINNYGQAGVYLFGSSHDTRIISNKIHDMVYSGGTYSNYGIYFASDATTVTEISNNLFYNIASKAKPFCIMIGTGGNIHLYHNTFYISGNIMSGTSTTYSACININNNNITQLDFQDNIFKNSAQPVSANPNITSYAIYNAGATSVFTKLDHNDYYIDGPNAFIGYQSGNQYTLAQWQTATLKDSASIVMDPVFNSPTTLVPTKDSLNNKGYYLASVPTDFYGNLRSNPPDQGAINFGLDPYIVTDSATNVLYNSAVINGMANAHSVATTVTFDYGLTTAYGSTTNATPNSVTDTTNHAVSANLSNLAYLTTYHFRAHGVTPAGVNFYGRDFTFTTPAAPPTVVTLAATNITATTATLHGTANANVSATTVTFEYGLTTSYGTEVNASPVSISDTITNSEMVALTGLLPNATYHFRIKGVNVGGTSYGIDMTFTTPAILPAVITNLPTSIGSNSAQLNGTVTANNAATNVFFQYGLTTAYGSIIAASPSTVNGMNATSVAANLSGLQVNATYHYRCAGSNIAGTVYGQDQVFTTNCVEPTVTISGPSSTCAGVTGYIYTTQTGNSNYEWNISAGGTITSGLGTSSITVTWNTVGPQTVSVNYSNQYNCSLSTPFVYNVTVHAVPTPTLTGSATACQHSTTNTYTTDAGMSSYVWTISQGGTITSGLGTSSIIVTWNNAGAQTISVNYNNASGCDALTPTTLAVTVDTLPVPTISGPSDLCANSGSITYTTQTGMSGYNWTVSAGGTLVAGQGTSSIQVTWNQPGSQTISVNYANSFGCSALTATSFPVTVNSVPGAAGTITGITTVCGGTTGVAYSCAPITNAAYYVWTLPAGATIASGAGTNAITVDYAANASSGDITVYGNNLCGNGTTSPALTVTVTSLPGTPGNITGPANVCQGESGIVYSVEPITGATTYTWTVPTGATIVSGNNTNSITVDFSATASTGAVTVFAGNSCGNGPVSSMTVTINAVPAAPVITLVGTTLHSNVANGNQWYLDGNILTGATNQDYNPAATGTYWDVVTTNNCPSDTSNHIYYIMLGINDIHSAGFSIYPVPNDGSFTVSISSPAAQSFTLGIYNNIGVQVYQSESFTVNGTMQKTIDIRPVSSGLYTVVLKTTDNQIIKKFLVNR